MGALTSEPDWLVTEQSLADAVAAWAASRGLAFERLGLLPAASEVLRIGAGAGWHQTAVRVAEHLDGAVRQYGKVANRPERFTENVCTGALAPGLRGAVGHHFGAVRRDPDEGWAVTPFTAVVGHAPAAGQVVRALHSERPVGGRTITLRDHADPPYGRLLQEADFTPALRDRIRWRLWFEDAPEFVAPALGEELASALSETPEDTSVVVGEGRIAVCAGGVLDLPGIEALIRVAAALAQGLERCAAGLPALDPDAPLPAPADTPLRRWAGEGAARLSWDTPPKNVPSAVEAYASGGGKRGLFGRRRRGASPSEAEAWGLEAFTAAYAQARGMVVEDREELRRRVAFPFPAAPERSLHGPLPGGGIGRLVLLVDHAELSDERFANLAIVRAPHDAIEPAPPFAAHRADGLLLVYQRVSAAGRSVAGLDALASEAVRLRAGENTVHP
jgi:hypothetical protein